MSVRLNGMRKMQTCPRLFVLIAGFLLAACQPSTRQSEQASSHATGFWTSPDPPRAHYTIAADIDPAAGRLQGSETVRFRNTTSRPLRRLALDWSLDAQHDVQVRSDGEVVPFLGVAADASLSAPLLFDLPEVAMPGAGVELEIEFGMTAGSSEGEKLTLAGWHPRLWWGVRTHDDYDVQVRAPEGYVVATSGSLNEKSGYYQAENVRLFGVFLGRDLSVAESYAGDVLVRSLFTEKGEECARLLHETAVDAIDFYRERFGLYPYPSLTIIPGSDAPMGGYPVATRLVAVHGQERMDERPEIHWRWITAHEIGHQYWGEYVLEKDSPDWLWIGLGFFADREYIRARGLSSEKHDGVMGRYIGARRDHWDTTIDRPLEQLSGVEGFYNQVVRHGKGFSVISALASVLGSETFDRAYLRALDEYGGRRLGAPEFRAIAEEESGQDLGWFFEGWVQSNRYASYEAIALGSERDGDRYLTRVEVRSLGTLRMPVPVLVVFEDGTRQTKSTDRLLEPNVLEFESSAPLTEVRLDPEGELALIVPPPGPAPPPTRIADLKDELRRMSLTGVGDEAAGLFIAARQLELDEPDLWARLGHALYDGEHYAESLEAFRRTSALAEETSVWRFVALTWQGHLLDLAGRREEALQAYHEALRIDTGATVRHDQYGIWINRDWIEARLETPFRR